MSMALEALDCLLDDHPTAVSVTSPAPANVVTANISAVWAEDRIERSYTEKGERTMRTGTLIIRDGDAPAYAFGEQWTVEGDLWQVEALPHTDNSIRIMNLRRDDKIKTSGSRSPHVL